jgi:hypothetical protein
MGGMSMNTSSETLRDAIHRLMASKFKEGFELQKIHEYTEADGQPIYWRIRLKHPDGRKEIRPMMFDGESYQLKEPAFTDKKPLYNLQGIASRPNDTVYIVEGEWCADQLNNLGLLATSSGSSGSADKADWKPLQGRTVIIWPDNDSAGKRYCEAVQRILEPLGCHVTVIDVDALGLPEKGDCVDWLAKHPATKTEDIAALAVAKPAPINTKTQTLAKVELLRASDITPEPIRWLWDGWLAQGKLHIIAGAPGTGKTTICMAMAAVITQGGKWPDGSRCNVGNVLIWTGEDDPQDTLVPRLIAHGADLDRVYFVQSVTIGESTKPFDPAHDLHLLKSKADMMGNISLLIVDPIVSAVAADSHKNSEVRRSLQPLVDLAVQLDCAVLGVSHFSKGTAGRDPTERVTGSLAFAALARVVMATAKEKEVDGKASQLLVRTKSNIGKDSGGFRYKFLQTEIKPALLASKVEWGESVDGTAHELLAKAEGMGEQSKPVDATDFIRGILADGAIDAKEVFRLGDESGFSKKQLQTASEKMQITKKRDGFGIGSKMVWKLHTSLIHPIHSHSQERESMASMGMYGQKDTDDDLEAATL